MLCLGRRSLNRRRAVILLALLWQKCEILTGYAFAAMRAMAWWRAQQAVKDGLTHSREARLRWRAGDSFFSVPPERAVCSGGMRRRSLS